MAARYSIKSDGEIFGPESMDAIEARLLKEPASQDSEIIIHSNLGDRHAPIAAFPQLRVRGYQPPRPEPFVRCVHCEQPTKKTSTGRFTCPNCGCNFEVDITGRVYDREGPPTKVSTVVGLIGLALMVATPLGYGLHWIGLGLLIISASALYSALKHRVVSLRGMKTTEAAEPGWFSFGLCVYVAFGLLGLVIIAASVLRHFPQA